MNNAFKFLFAVSLLVTGFFILPNHKTSLVPEGLNVTALPPGDYEELWKQVDSLGMKGLSESALKLVEEIYTKAETEKNQPQLIKALIHFSKFTNAVQDEGLKIIIHRFMSEIEKSKGPTNSILKSCLAQILWGYYENNYWMWQSRTQTANFVLEDVDTWDLKTGFAACLHLYLSSVENSAELKKVPLGDFKDILIEYDGSKKYRPTLYDFLANRTLDFLENEQAFLTQPAYAFVMKDPVVFKPGAEFIKADFPNKDTLSMRWHALHLYKDLIEFHLHDADPLPLAMLEVERFTFAKNSSVIDNKDELYLDALEKLQNQLKEDPFAAQVGYLRANWYFANGPQVSYGYYGNEEADPFSTDSSKIQNKKKSMDLCKSIISRWPESDGANNCQNLVFYLQQKYLHTVTEQVNYPGTWSRFKLSYRNCDKVNFRVAKISKKERKELEESYNESTTGKVLSKIRPLKSWQLSVKDPGDYNTHSVEAGMEPLEPGEYVLLSCTDAKFPEKGDQISYTIFVVSTIGYTSSENLQGGTDFMVFNRETGHPLKGVKGQMIISKYDYVARKYVETNGESFLTDENGHIHVPIAKKEDRNFGMEFSYDKDFLGTAQNFWQSQYDRYDDDDRDYLTMLTDRSIYRPGQTIYFKGIATKRESGKIKIRKDESVTVTFYDVNDQEVGTKEFKTNDFGSFSGSFVAPQGVLTGQMRIGNYDGFAYISVEEYKRPKFEVEFEPVKESFRLNDLVKVKGNAKAYAGSVIDNAKVHYRVVRNASFPYYWCWWKPLPSAPQMEIISGDTTTNETGEFSVSFKALPDVSISKDLKPQFSYTVMADITDISGETRGTSVHVLVGYVALSVSFDLPEGNVNRDEDNQWGIFTKNLNGQFEPAKGTITIQKLQNPGRIFRERLWTRPDQFVYSKDEFYQKFPKDVYDKEDDFHTWTKGAKVLDVNFDTEKDDTLKPAGIQSWEEGKYYSVLTTKDKYGVEVKVEKYFTVYSTKTNAAPNKEWIWFSALKTKAEPDEEVSFAIASAEQDAKVWMEIIQKGKVISSKWISLSDSKSIEKIPVIEEYRGNFHCVLFIARNGRFYTYNQTFYIPWTNKELKVEFETFRDKMVPGAKEEWKVKISGQGNEMVAAEMLAGMYDASLDAFTSHGWYLENVLYDYDIPYYSSVDAFSVSWGRVFSDLPANPYYIRQQYFDILNWFGGSGGYSPYTYRWGGEYNLRGGNYDVNMVVQGETLKGKKGLGGDFKNAEKMDGDSFGEDVPMTIATGNISELAVVDKLTASFIPPGEPGDIDSRKGEFSVRKNLNELAFFFPHLQTDEKGSIIFSFTVPEALTKWKFMALAHTADLKMGQLVEESVTQKDLMIMPNPPRFLRENDKFFFTAKVSNLADKDFDGEAWLEIYDALTMQPVDAKFGNSTAAKTFNAKKGQSAGLSWELTIPEGIQAVMYRVKAKANNFTDGEEAPIPILTNRMLVTEAMPLPMRAGQTRSFTFDKLINNKSTTLRNHKLTLEYTSNPAWYAVQALPYLMEYPYECSEQTFSRYYANSIASFIANSNPKIKAVFDAWKANGKESLLSNLEKNQELKYVLLEETPWVLQANNETERKNRVGLLFDLNQMANEMGRAFDKLEKAQTPNGGFPWFKGMPDDPYITQHIMAGMGKMVHLGVVNPDDDYKLNSMLTKMVEYCDNRIRERYVDIKRWAVNMEDDHIGYSEIHYLYARSFFTDQNVDGRNKEAFDYFMKQAKKYWLNKGRYAQGMTALAVNRFEPVDGEVQFEASLPVSIIKSLKENSMHSDELGMYWKENVAGYYWYEAPIEFQAMMIEAFDEIADDQATVDELKLWLLKNKQTCDWRTTKATVEACYAMLLRGTDFLADSKIATIKVGNMTLDPNSMPDVKVEAGTGYFKTSWSGTEIKPEMGTVEVTNPNQVASWGAMYWQYFEQLDKITPAETPISIKKELFLQKDTDRGPVITPVTEGTILKPGDLIKVRMEIRVDREMNYVHIKDMRASGFEPVNVLSQYKWQDGLGYYESTRDASTNFFISVLPKGTYVFEYPVRVTHKGDFSNGITTIQCMYAPEFTSHTQGIRVKVN